jgi:hypothetical protein
VSFDRVSEGPLQGRFVARRRLKPASRVAPGHPVMALQRAIGNGAVASMLQRAPTSRQTEHRTSFGKRIKGKDQAEKLEKFANMRTGATQDGTLIVRQLQWDHIWGGLKSDVTGTGDDYSVRIDRQSPTPTHSNIQIQTNGVSVSVATVLIADSLSTASATARNGIMRLVRAALLSSLADGMQWEVYDDAPQPTAKPPEPKVKDTGSGKGGGKGKWNDTRRDRGGAGGGGNPLVGVQ